MCVCVCVCVRERFIYTVFRSDRGYSCKVQQMVKRLEREGKTSEVERETKREKHEHRNWKQVSQRELDKMGTVARSRYLAVSCPDHLFTLSSSTEPSLRIYHYSLVFKTLDDLSFSLVHSNITHSTSRHRRKLRRGNRSQ